jgi:hypothetical protein
LIWFAFGFDLHIDHDERGIGSTQVAIVGETIWISFDKHFLSTLLLSE